MREHFKPLANYKKTPEDEMLSISQSFYEEMKQRRSIRHFSNEDVPQMLIDRCIQTAGTAPSGANQQPWHFCVIRDPEIKHEIRTAAEAEEREFYAGRAGDTWLETLEPLGTDANKPFLDVAPVLIAIFEQKYTVDETGKHIKNYYSKESTGIATGMLITALHKAGLVSLTHTPSPMNFLSKILDRPEGERPFLLLVVGHPSLDAQVPNINKKDLKEISSIF